MKNQKIFWGGGTAPSPDPSASGEGDTTSPHPTPLGAFGASILAPTALDLGASILAPAARGPRRLRRLVLGPPFGNPGSATVSTQDFLIF